MITGQAPYLIGGTALVRAKHNDIGGGVGEFLGVKLLVLLEKLHVGATADQGVLTCQPAGLGDAKQSRLTLRLDLILNHQSLALVVDLLRELGGNGVVGSRVLDDEALVALHSLQNRRLFDLPGTDVGPFLLRLGVILLSVGRSPSGFPAIGELLKEGSFESGGLEGGVSNAEKRQLTAKESGKNCDIQ